MEITIKSKLTNEKIFDAKVDNDLFKKINKDYVIDIFKNSFYKTQMDVKKNSLSLEENFELNFNSFCNFIRKDFKKKY